MKNIALFFRCIHNRIIYFIVRVFRCSSFHLSIKSLFKNVSVIDRRGKCIKVGPWALLKNGKMQITKNGSISIETGVSLENFNIQANGGNIVIGEKTFFNLNPIIVSLSKVEIGCNCAFGPNVSIFDHDHVYLYDGDVDWSKFKTSPIYIGNNVWVGANVVILRGTNIGDNCVIGAGSVVKGDIPPHSIVRSARFTVDTIKKLDK